MSGLKPTVPDRVPMGILLPQIKKELGSILEAQPTLALIIRAKYESLKQAGFSEEQAIKLCR